MPIDVFPWPPVGAVGSEWTEDAPVARLRSALTGRDQMQASQRVRRIATVEVSAIASGRLGAGYCEMLKHFLAGGIHAVRLQSGPINWHLDDARRRAAMNSEPLDWRADGTPLGWRANALPVLWYSGRVVRGGVPFASGEWGFLPVSGLPRRVRVAGPGDFIRIYDVLNPAVSEVARVIREAVTDGSGGVVLKLDRVPQIADGRVNMVGQDEGVFRVDGPLPRAVQPLSGDWSYTWKFREVFADEVGGFRERANVWT
jgi:hypothetical protein